MKKLRSHTFRGKEIAREITGYPVDLTDNGCADRSSGTHVLDDSENGALKIPYQKSSPLSMLDTLPSFMALSAAQSALQALPVSDVWMRLAAGYMAHAALEQKLLHGVHLTDALNEAFAWRFDPESSAEEGSDEWAINTMFFGEGTYLSSHYFPFHNVSQDKRHVLGVFYFLRHVLPLDVYPREEMLTSYHLQTEKWLAGVTLEMSIFVPLVADPSTSIGIFACSHTPHRLYHQMESRYMLTSSYCWPTNYHSILSRKVSCPS